MNNVVEILEIIGIMKGLEWREKNCEVSGFSKDHSYHFPKIGMYMAAFFLIVFLSSYFLIVSLFFLKELMYISHLILTLSKFMLMRRIGNIVSFWIPTA